MFMALVFFQFLVYALGILWYSFVLQNSLEWDNPFCHCRV